MLLIKQSNGGSVPACRHFAPLVIERMMATVQNGVRHVDRDQACSGPACWALGLPTTTRSRPRLFLQAKPSFLQSSPQGLDKSGFRLIGSGRALLHFRLGADTVTEAVANLMQLINGFCCDTGDIRPAR